MWFWINFSPIGQAPPAPKKNTEPEHGGDKDKDGGKILPISTLSHE